MASLDDFFAKKDKSKRGKKNKLTPEELARQIEVSGSSHSRRKDRSEDDDYSHRGSDLISNFKILDQLHNDEEWKDFEDEREKDYRGLKIQSLTLKNKEDEMLEKQRAALENGNEKTKDDSGPWNKRAVSPVPEKTEEPKSQEEIKKETLSEEAGEKEDPSKDDASSVVKPKKYIAPALRGGSGGGGSGSTASDNLYRPPRPLSPISLASATRKHPKGAMPKINDEQDFPSLGD